MTGYPEKEQPKYPNIMETVDRITYRPKPASNIYKHGRLKTACKTHAEELSISMVTQEDHSGCGIACVAMLCNKTYQEVKDVWVNELGGDPLLLDALGNGAGITTNDIERLLHFYGFQQDIWMTPRIVRVQQQDYKWMYHFVVIDVKGIVLDPAAII